MYYGFGSQDLNTVPDTSSISEQGDYVIISQGGNHIKRISYGQLAQNVLKSVRLTINGETLSVEDLFKKYSQGIEYGDF